MVIVMDINIAIVMVATSILTVMDTLMVGANKKKKKSSNRKFYPRMSDKFTTWF